MVQLNSSQPVSSDLIFAQTPANQAASSGSTDPSSSASTESFANQLASEIEGYLSQSGNGSQFEINVQNGTGANGGFTITVTNPAAASASSSTSATSSSKSAASGMTGSYTAMGLYNADVAPAATPARSKRMGYPRRLPVRERQTRQRRRPTVAPPQGRRRTLAARLRVRRHRGPRHRGQRARAERQPRLSWRR